MIPRNASPVSHVPPRKRIEIGRPDPPHGDPNVETEGTLARALRIGEQERIWRHLVQIAQGAGGSGATEEGAA